MSTPQHWNLDEHTALFIARTRQRVHNLLYGPTPTLLLPLSWMITMQVSMISVCWYMFTRPIAICLDIYERHIRAIFPQLPSIQRALLTVRTEVLAFFPALGQAPAANSFAAQGTTNHGNGNPSTAPVAPLPTLPVDLNSIIAGSS